MPRSTISSPGSGTTVGCSASTRSGSPPSPRAKDQDKARGNGNCKLNIQLTLTSLVEKDRRREAAAGLTVEHGRCGQ